MATRKALQIKGTGRAELVSDVPFPKLRDDYILVKTVAVALNPTDWKHIDWFGSAGAIVGCDYAGIVQEVGSKVNKSFAKGDRVCGFVHGSNSDNHDDGAFADYIVAKGDLQIKIPDDMSFEEASTLGVGITTVGQALYQSLGLPFPSEPAEKPFPLLIYGGSTATGTLAIQFAKLSGLEVITTCSPKHFDLLKSYGADHVFDYRSPTCAADIRKVTNDGLTYVLDCISTDETARVCADSIGVNGGRYSTLGPVENFPRGDVDNLFTLAYTAIGDTCHLGEHEFPANPEDFHFAVKFWAMTEQLLKEGKVKVHPVTKRPGGLEGILEGLQEMREGRVSGGKLVYTLSD